MQSETEKYQKYSGVSNFLSINSRAFSKPIHSLNNISTTNINSTNSTSTSSLLQVQPPYQCYCLYQLNIGMASEVTYACSCNFDDDGGTCAHCKRSFDNLSHFIRHVTHSKACKANYDPRAIESFKKTSRKITKQKWYHHRAHGSHSKSFNEERKQRREKDKKIYYLPNNIKHSECGRAFESLFKAVFDNCLEEAKLMIEKQCNEQKSLMEEAFDEAMDTTFGLKQYDCPHSAIISAELQLEARKIEDNEEQILEAAFQYLETNFNWRRGKILDDKRGKWKDYKFTDVSFNLFPTALNKAFLSCYDKFEFKSLYERAIDNTLDMIFLTLITTEGYFDYKGDDDLDSKMSNAYWSVMKVEVKKLFDENTELQTAMKTVMEDILKKQFESYDLTYSKE